MARQTPLPELEKQIGQRLRKFRIEQVGLSSVEFSRRIGIDSNRLATYEHGRAPLRYEIADAAARTFNICQRWLAEEKEPVRYYVSIPEVLRERFPQRSLFSSIYNGFLKSFVDDHLAELQHLGAGKMHDELLEVVQELGQNTVGQVGMLDVLIHLQRKFVHTIDEIPPDKYQPFYSHIVLACQEFLRTNAQRIEEWKKTPKVTNPPTWPARANKSYLTDLTQRGKTFDVKSELEKLIARIKRAVTRPGAKSELARFLKVAPSRITEWLSDDPKLRREPGGYYTLELLKWVEHQERRK